MSCTRCGSKDINPHLHGREPGVDEDLCDVCYWRSRYEALKSRSYHYWSEEDDQFIREHAHSMTYKEMASHLNCTYFAVAVRANQLGVIKRRRLTPAECEEVIALRTSGSSTTKELATRFGVSIKTITNIVKRSGHPLPNTARVRLTPNEKAEIEQRYREGEPITQIADALAHPDDRIRRYLEEKGLHTRRKAQTYPPEMIERIMSMRNNGMTYAEIAEIIDRTPSGIANALFNRGLTKTKGDKE